MKVPYFLILAVALLLVVGCKEEPYSVAPVSGRVTFNGKALANCEVMFQPVHTASNYNPGPGSYGITDADGRFTLKLIGKETPGAVVGKHKVRFSMRGDPGDPSDDRPRVAKASVQLPAKYNDIEGKMEYDVPAEGAPNAEFTLSSQ